MQGVLLPDKLLAALEGLCCMEIFVWLVSELVGWLVSWFVS